MKSPLVSVILPVRNGALFIEAAVRSILGQTMQDLELVVVDDGSTDETPRILQSLARQDSRLRVESAQGKGLVDALNQGCSLSRSSLLARMDADDVAIPQRLATQVFMLQSDACLGLVGAAVTVVDESGRYLYQMRFPTSDLAIRKALRTGSAFAHPTVVMRRHHLERVGGYRHAFLNAEDYDLWLRMSEECRLANHAQPLLEYRVQSHQASPRYLEQQWLSTIGARVSARARRSGRSDRLFRAPQVTRAELIRAGLPPASLAMELVECAATQALFLCAIGKPHQALTLLTWATSQCQFPLSSHSDARLSIVSGIAAWMLGRPVRGLTRLARGSLLDVPYAFNLAYKALGGSYGRFST